MHYSNKVILIITIKGKKITVTMPFRIMQNKLFCNCKSWHIIREQPHRDVTVRTCEDAFL